MDKEKPGHHETSGFETQGESPKITDGPEDLKYQGSFVAMAMRCRNLNWRLAAVDARELVDLEVNLTEPVELWLRQCSRTGPLRGRVNLGVHTGSSSGLLVLEVENGEGKSLLDQCGNWRSSCLARLNGREQHYFTLPPGSIAPPTRFLKDHRVMIYGEAGLATLPPSLDVQTRESWCWSIPPWESSPPDLPLSLWAFLQQAATLVPESDGEPEIPTWEEIYRLITPHEPLLKALLAPFSTLEEHYHNLLETALDVGFHDKEFLLGLLWNSPQGDGLENPERGGQLKHMVCEARIRPFNSHKFTTPQLHPDDGILVSRSRFELILGELRNLMEKAAELEAVLLGWEQPWAEASTPASVLPVAASQLPKDHGAELPESACGTEQLFAVAYESMARGEQKTVHYSQMNTDAQRVASSEVMGATVHTCLEHNPDLADDPDKLRMVQYCFTNYVNIDPTPFRLEYSGKIGTSQPNGPGIFGILRLVSGYKKSNY
jgi:hypothetical protein